MRTRPRVSTPLSLKEQQVCPRSHPRLAPQGPTAEPCISQPPSPAMLSFDQGSRGAQKWLTLGSWAPYTAWCGGTETSWPASPSSVRCGLPRPGAAQAAGRARARPRFGSVGSLVETCTKANRMRGQRTEAQQGYPHPQVT